MSGYDGCMARGGHGRPWHWLTRNALMVRSLLDGNPEKSWVKCSAKAFDVPG